MKLLLSLLTLLFIFGPLQAQPAIKLFPSIREKVSAQIPHKTAQLEKNNALKQQGTQESQVQEHALNQLAKRQDPKNWKRISWQEFLKQNEYAKNREGVCLRLDLKCTEHLCNICPAPIPLEALSEITQQPADYKKLLKDEKLIYIMDSSNHDTKAIPLEVAKIMRAVREANPNARILLAAEFLTWNSPYNVLGATNIKNDLSFKYNEYQKYYEYLQCARPESQNQQPCADIVQVLQLLKQEINNPTPLLKKAGQKSGLYELDSYAPIFQAADQLGIDQLALDDNLYGIDAKNNIGVKVGEYVIVATPRDNIPSWKSLKKQAGESAKEYAMSQLISVSSWGVLERNREWARRITAVMPMYDIVLVYAGDGHLANTYFIDLQPLVGRDNFTNIKLYAQEELPQELETYYQQRQNISERKGLSRDEKNWKEIEVYLPAN
uniref:Haem-binding uptake Tiki superfamily ChaN domain-containing protein n=1 Tax=uncultured Elusimicrobia bacterium TaxID=699876 RepID=A0A650ENF5_9BACT|nr:hypothetical protein Elusimicrob2101_1140 [uncultured Elusimicrobia bacterium]